jgi:hypothetical protein
MYSLAVQTVALYASLARALRTVRKVRTPSRVRSAPNGAKTDRRDKRQRLTTAVRKNRGAISDVPADLKTRFV